MRVWPTVYKSFFNPSKTPFRAGSYAVSISFSRPRYISVESSSINSVPSHEKLGTKSPKSIKYTEPTIYALSTAPGRAAIAIIRVSGSACLTVYQALCPGKLPPKPRYATLRTLYEPRSQVTKGSVIDAGALVLHFPAPDTVTGEDVLEFHVHGGTAVVKAILAAIPKAIIDGNPQRIRYAEPGEFTRRAFYNNRLDLLQIEALSDTLSAETEQQRRLAVKGSTRTQAQQYEAWRLKLLQARGELEALIDFSEDQHFDESPAKLCASVADQVQQLRSILEANIENASRGELLRNGINIALIGAPNAGKSSLLNQIVGREAAIVSSEAGTTRDVVDINVDVGGYLCRIGDLAGLRNEFQSPDTSHIGDVEKEGMRRARDRARTADVIIVVISAAVEENQEDPAKPRFLLRTDPEVLEVLKQCRGGDQKIVSVVNKTDLFYDRAKISHQDSQYWPKTDSDFYCVSCKYAQDKSFRKSDPGGIQYFLDGLVQLFGRMTTAVIPQDTQVTNNNSAWAESLGATERQRSLLQQCLEHLESFLAEVTAGEDASSGIEGPEEDIDLVLAAESLRSAADCLARITGKGEAGDVEEVLGVVFEKFCVGK